MKAVLISIQPKWCELIASGKKTVEIRKTKPKIDVPFKVYIYCTKDNSFAEKTLRGFDENGKAIYYNANKGKVIGEFVCRRIDTYPYNKNGYGIAEEHLLCTLSCIEEKELYHYLQGSKPYAWNISDLVIYDKPKELSEFQRFAKTEHCGWGECDLCRHGDFDQIDEEWFCRNIITKPPQSWCYVEERRAE